MIPLSEVRFEAFSGGPGGQYANRHLNCVRAIHEPTGTVAVASSERSMRQNKAAALENLKAKIKAKFDGWRSEQRRKRHDAKPDATFGHAIRIYRLCGKDQSVIDRRVDGQFGIEALKRGKLDPLLRAIQRAQAKNS